MRLHFYRKQISSLCTSSRKFTLETAMCSERVLRPPKRRAPSSSPTHQSLGLTRNRRRYQEEPASRDSPTLNEAHNKDVEAKQQVALYAVDSNQPAMVVATSARLQNSADTLSPTRSRCMRQKRYDAERRNRKILNVQKALIADSDGDRPLHLAVVHRDAVLVRQICGMLHSVQAPLDFCNYMRQTPLHLAVILREPHLVEVLLEEGCSLSPRDSRGNTPLHLACTHSAPDCLNTILRCSPQQAKEVINERNFEGKTSLHIAVADDNAAVVRALAGAGCDVNIGDGKSGRPPLMHAIYDRNMAMVRVLLQCGACPDKQDYAGNCGHTAACETDEGIADMLASRSSAMSSR